MEPSYLKKIQWSWPWLIRYPFWRAKTFLQSLADQDGPRHLIVSVANHYEPAWNEDGSFSNWEEQARRVESWCRQARATGSVLRDHDGTPFRHTNFFPGEQCHHTLLEMLADLEKDGYGEVEIHLHHGEDKPDTAENLRRALVEFRDLLAEEYKCLSRERGDDRPRYAFVHGNLALANSMGGKCCGVDSEMEILAETGCYLDMTLPAAPLEPQTPVINTIYECGRPLSERAPHRTGHTLRVGQPPVLPVILTGPLVFNWRRRYGLPVPRIDDGALTDKYPLPNSRFHDWLNARISIQGRPEWIFIKLYCHGFFTNDQEATLGEPVKRFWSEALEEADRGGQLKIHFASARETFNIAMAAVDGHAGNPSSFRNYRLQPIRQTSTIPSRQMKVSVRS